MMDIEILQKSKMSESGSSLLRLMQSHTIPPLDLFVRESIQNSLDASKNRNIKSRVEVEFLTGTFEQKSLTDQFPYISQRLQTRYPESLYNFIAVKDSGTTGLTGSNDPNDDHSRLQSLIYQISKKQLQEGSGGNWGLGKTTFFKLGIGLVIYYSRTFESGHFCSKLAASLVEDETKTPLITELNSRGIAFFGKNPSNNDKKTDNQTVPITNDESIRSFLKIFSIEPYNEDNTGTTIIIPYVDFAKELKNMLPKEAQSSNRLPVWADSIEDCLKYTIQRWYAPRISNPEFNGPWLKPIINGEVLSKSKMEPMFRLLQELYNYASNSAYNSEFLKSLNNDSLKQSPITCKEISGSGGTIASILISPADVKLTTEINRNPYALIGEYSATIGEPIITFTRKPGMLVRYVTRDSPWIPKIDFSPDSILVGVFKLTSESQLKNSGSLEEYVRSCEKSDHHSWEDDSSHFIIKKLSENTASRLQKLYSIKQQMDSKKLSKLCDVFTNTFLPSYESRILSETHPIRTSSGKGSKKPGKSHKRGKTETDRNDLHNSVRTVVTTSKLPSNANYIEYEFRAASEIGSISADDWEDSIGKPYPIIFKSIQITGYSKLYGTLSNCFYELDLSKNYNIYRGIEVTVKRTARYKIPFAFRFNTESPGFNIKCQFMIESCFDSVVYEMKTLMGDN